MGKYILKRIILMIPVILGVSFIIFIAMNWAQGDYVDTLIVEDMSAEELDALRAKYNLDKPIVQQYLIYMWNFMHGDLGTSWNSGLSVMDEFMKKLPNTIYLGLMASLIGTVVSIPLGILAARKRGGFIDNLASVVAVFGISAPNFWFGILLIMLFSLKLGWVPSGGNEVWYAVLLPAITLGTDKMASLTRTTRSTMLDTLSADYLRTARSKGVPEKTVINKHALKPASIPIIYTVMAQLSGAVSGAALTETVFTWPGVGRIIVDSVRSRDIPMACGSLIMICILIGLIELVTDLLYVLVDPRLRTHYASASSGKKAKAQEETAGVKSEEMANEEYRKAFEAQTAALQQKREEETLSAAARPAEHPEEAANPVGCAVKEEEEASDRTKVSRSALTEPAPVLMKDGKRVRVSTLYAKRSQLGDFWHRFSQNKGALVGMAIIALLALNCIFADVIFDYDTQIAGYDLMEAYQAPSADHWFGTDDYGRDIFARTMYGARYSLAIGLATVALALAIGVPIGATAGYCGGVVDLLLFRLLDILGAIPGLLMGIVVVAALGQSTQSLVIAMAISQIPGTARITRTAVMTVKNNEYIESARAIGMPIGHIIFRHILPNCLSPIIVRITLQVAGSIVAASSLSFLGLGVPVPSPEWGALLSAGRAFIRNYSYMTTFPGLAIMITVMAFNMMGDGLRDALDPKLKK